MSFFLLTTKVDEDSIEATRSLGELNDEIVGDALPRAFGNGEWLEETDWLAGPSLVALADITGVDVTVDELLHGWPIVRATD